MKLNSKFPAIRLLSILLCITIFSFAPKPGGDSFEIWVNGRMVVQQYVHVARGIQTLQLTQTSDKDQLDVYYRHCGQTGKDRCITIKDENNRSLKVWKFANANGDRSAMSFKVKDILGLKKNKNSKLNLFYSSKELPTGRSLATIVSANENGIASR